MIVQYPDEVLKKVSYPVTDGEPVLDIVEQMKQELDKANGLGMAAVQVGILKRIIIIRDVITHDVTAMINPEITGFGNGDKIESEEGCLSFFMGRPRVTITRYKSITVSYKDLSFDKQSQCFEGLPARIIQHETDHVNGIMITDHLSRLKRKMLFKKQLKSTPFLETCK